jgi:hypothetical protein
MMNDWGLIDTLFNTASKRSGSLQYNPVTGGLWVPGLDPIEPQKKLARRALNARSSLAESIPASGQPFPLNDDERRASARMSDLGCIVASYSRCLAANDFDLARIPMFGTYAAGMLAHPYYGKALPTLGSRLVKRFPPRPLILGNNCAYYAYW